MHFPQLILIEHSGKRCAKT